MHAHPGEVVAETALHINSERRTQRPAGAGEHLVDAGWNRVDGYTGLIADPLDAQRTAVGQRGRRRSKDLIGDSVRFTLVDVTRRVHGELRLQREAPLPVARLALP